MSRVFYLTFGFIAFLIFSCPHVLSFTGHEPAIPSGGSSSAYPLYSQLFFGWEQLVPHTLFAYEQTSSIRGMSAVINKTVVWSGTEVQPRSSEEQAARANNVQLKMFPSVLVSVVPYANYRSLGVSGLSMTKRTLALIWLGNITSWNDPAIVVTNPALAAVNESIQLVIQDEPSGLVEIFQTAIAKLLQPGEWPYNISQVWPTELLARWGNRVIYTTIGNQWTFATVSLSPFSFGYVAESLLIQVGVPTSFVLVDTESNTSIAPDPAALVAAAEATIFDPLTGAALLNSSSLPDDAWPFYGYSYLLFNSNFSGMNTRQCKFYRDVFQLWIWMYTENDPRELALNLGYAIVPRAETNRIIAELLSYRCAGSTIVDLQFEEQRSEPVWDAMLAIAMIFVPIPVVLALAAAIKMFRRTSNVFFIISTATGSCMLLVAVIFFYLVPSDTSICILRTFLVGLGFALLVAPISTKVLWCLWIVHKTKELKRVQMPFARIAMPLLVALALQLTVLIVWAAVDPYSSTVEITNHYLQTAIYVCSSEDNWVWFGIEIGFFAALLLTAFILFWSTGSTALRSLHDVSWMGFTLYNLLFLMILLIPLLAGFDNSEDERYFVICIGLIFPALFTSCTLYGPIVLPQVFYMMGSVIRTTSNTSAAKPISSSEPKNNSFVAQSLRSGKTADTSSANPI